MDISGVGRNLAAREYSKVTDKKSGEKEAGAAKEPKKAAGDSVEISSQGSLVSKVSTAGQADRQQKVQGIKAEIEAGTYITQEKLYSAVDSAIDSALGSL